MELWSGSPMIGSRTCLSEGPPLEGRVLQLGLEVKLPSPLFSDIHSKTWHPINVVFGLRTFLAMKLWARFVRNHFEEVPDEGPTKPSTILVLWSLPRNGVWFFELSWSSSPPSRGSVSVLSFLPYSKRLFCSLSAVPASAFGSTRTLNLTLICSNLISSDLVCIKVWGLF